MNYTAIDDMCIALAAQIRTYVQPSDTLTLPQTIGLDEVVSEDIENIGGRDLIVVTDGDFDLVAGGGFSSVIMVVNYYRVTASAAPEDRELRQALERIRNAIMSNESIIGGAMSEGLTAEKGLFPGAEEGESITGGQILVNYHVPQGAFAQESRG
ncbi:MAG: hypothetical protein V3W37_03170 [Candidatus Binatia bacterium]